jgi:hypothetical protein
MRSLGGRAKNLSLKHLVDLDQPDIIFIQETTGPCAQIIYDLVKLFPSWTFYGVDSNGFSRGLITGFSSNCSMTNCFFISLGLFTELYCKELDPSLSLLNLYEPYVSKSFGTGSLAYLVYILITS